jgi:hypothetical protein
MGLGLVVALTAACASFPADRLPRVDEVPSQGQFSNRPSVNVPLRFMIDTSGGAQPAREVNGPIPTLRQVVEKVATDAALFRSVTFDSSSATDADYVLRIDITNYGDIGKATAAGVITGLTLFIVPTAATDNYKLTAKLFDSGGQLLHTYSYDDAVTTWIGIWLLPVAGKTPRSAIESVWENMIRTLFRDILKDRLLRYSEASPHLTWRRG